MTYEQQIAIWSRAVKESAKEILSSKAKTLKFMKRVGIVAKDGKRLGKAYR